MGVIRAMGMKMMGIQTFYMDVYMYVIHVLLGRRPAHHSLAARLVKDLEKCDELGVFCLYVHMTSIV